MIDLQPLGVPHVLRVGHVRIGGRDLRRWVHSYESGEVLRVMYGLEPCGEDDTYIGHLSVSVAKSSNANEPPTRLPTDDEFAAALVLRPKESWEESDEGGSLVRHAWTE